MDAIDLVRNVAKRIENKGWEVVRSPVTLQERMPPIVWVSIERSDVREVTIGRSEESVRIRVVAVITDDSDEPDVAAYKVRQELEPVIVGAWATMQLDSYEIRVQPSVQGPGSVEVALDMRYSAIIQYTRGNP